MDKWFNNLLFPLTLLALAAAIYFSDFGSVVTVEPETDIGTPIARPSKPIPPKTSQRIEPSGSSRLAVGERYATLHDLESDQLAAGFIRTGYFGKHWPGRVVEIKTDRDGIRFVRANGTPHSYQGFDGYRMKMVRLSGPGRQETIVIFRSVKKG